MSVEEGSNYAQPSEDGHFGIFGGRFVAETLTHALDELEALYNAAKEDPVFQAELVADMTHYVATFLPPLQKADYSERIAITLKYKDAAANESQRYKIRLAGL